MKLNTSKIVFANPVRDLTMARYLAAMGVDFMGIDLDSMDLQRTKAFIHQIKEWVYGPRLIGVSAAAVSNLHELYALDGYFVDSEMQFPDEILIFHSHHFFIQHPGTKPSYIIIQQPMDNLNETPPCILQTVVHSGPEKNKHVVGYMIYPGAESKIGINDFDELDSWFERKESLGM